MVACLESTTSTPKMIKKISPSSAKTTQTAVAHKRPPIYIERESTPLPAFQSRHTQITECTALAFLLLPWVLAAAWPVLRSARSPSSSWLWDSNDNDDDHKSKNERKKNHAAQGRKGAPGSKRDDQLPKIVKKVWAFMLPAKIIVNKWSLISRWVPAFVFVSVTLIKITVKWCVCDPAINKYWTLWAECICKCEPDSPSVFQHIRKMHSLLGCFSPGQAACWVVFLLLGRRLLSDKIRWARSCLMRFGGLIVRFAIWLFLSLIK